MLLDDSFQRNSFWGGGGELEMAFSVIQHLHAFFSGNDNHIVVKWR